MLSLLLIAILLIKKNVSFSTSHNNFVILFLMILAKFFLIIHFLLTDGMESMTSMVIEDHIFKIALFLKYLSLYDLIKTIQGVSIKSTLKDF